MKTRLPRPRLLLTLSAALILPAVGCQSQRPASQLGTISLRSAESYAGEAPAIPTRSLAPSDIAEPVASNDSSAAGWADAALVIERSDEPVEWSDSGNDGWVRMTVPIRLRIDEDLAARWAEVSARDLGGNRLGRTRLLSRGEVGTTAGSTGSALPDSLQRPLIHVDRIAPLGPDRLGTYRIGWATSGGWGAEVDVFESSDMRLLQHLLEESVAPRDVEMYAMDASGQVVFGASLPLLPCDRVRVGRPQPLVCTWWIRDRAETQNDRPRWRNAQQWLAPNRPLAFAMSERPETVGDLMFLPMLGWQAMSSSPPIAVGGLDLSLDVSVPHEIAPRIDSISFTLRPRN
jgi:hypothetical protein